MNLPARRKGGQRRSRHPMPDLTRIRWEGGRSEEHGASVRRGPQAELCRRTACCVCWAVSLGMTPANLGTFSPDWTRLPAGESIAHHEPEGIHSDDDDTIPLCVRHHTGPLYVSRHPHGPRRFWTTYPIDWTAVRDEMRRRVAQTSKRTGTTR